MCVQVHCSFSGLGRDSVKRTVILFSKCNLTWRRTCVRSTATTVRQFVSSANTLALSSSPFSPLYPFFLSSTNEAFPRMKQPIVWILARATKERVVERGKVALSF